MRSSAAGFSGSSSSTRPRRAIRLSSERGSGAGKTANTPSTACSVLTTVATSASEAVPPGRSTSAVLGDTAPGGKRLANSS